MIFATIVALWIIAFFAFKKAKAWYQKAKDLEFRHSFPNYHLIRDNYHNRRDAFACLSFVCAFSGTVFLFAYIVDIIS